jgi:CRP-like cAMP-binding protein
MPIATPGLHIDPGSPVESSLLKKLRRRDDVSEHEAGVLHDLFEPPQLVGVKTDMIREGSRPTTSTLLVEGFAARYKVLENGSRQFTAVHGPGDFVDLHSYLLKTMDHGVLAVTDCRIVKVQHADLQTLTRTEPHLSRLLWLLTLIDGAVHREWIVGRGRRSAVSAFAHLYCELCVQLDMVGLVQNRQFLLPFTQTDMADILGLSSVHVNRTLQFLRQEGYLSHDGVVDIHDWDGLVAVAEFDPTYLYLNKEPR